jgi:uncharacterized protein YkwD
MKEEHHMLNILRALLPALIVLNALAMVSAMGADTTADPATANQEREIIALTNKEREAQHLTPLKENATLRKVAVAHSENMAKQETLSHELDGQKPEERIKAAGYQYLSIGENVAYNDPTPAAVLEAWMNSPGHRANILNKDFTEIGVGIARDKDGQPYYTQEFGRPTTAGMTAIASFTVKNDSSQPVRVGMIDPKEQRATTLIGPGGSGKFHVAGTGQLPKMRASNDEGTRDFDIKDGATIVIKDENGALNVSTPEPAAQPR